MACTLARWRVEGADGAGSWHETAHTYDSQSRLVGATLESVEANYSYAAGKNSVIGLSTPLAGLASSSVGIWARDAAGRVDTLLWQRAGVIYGGHDYAHDGLGHRTKDVREDGMKAVYAYNDRGELTSAQRLLASGGAALPAWSQGYLYDDVGNAVSRTTPEGETLAFTTSSWNWLDLQNAPLQRWLRGRANSGHGQRPGDDKKRGSLEAIYFGGAGSKFPILTP